MPRPKKKQITFQKESVLALMQEIYNECVEQRNTAIRIQNKMLTFMQGTEDLQLLGPVIKEQQKIVIDNKKSTKIKTRIKNKDIAINVLTDIDILIDIIENQSKKLKSQAKLICDKKNQNSETEINHQTRIKNLTEFKFKNNE